MWACKLGYAEIVVILLEKGADVSVVDKVRFTLSILCMIIQYAVK